MLRSFTLLAVISVASAQYDYGPYYPATTAASAAPADMTGGYQGPATPAADSAGGTAPAFIPGVTYPFPKLLVAHMVCGALATLLFLPLGAIVPRIARTYTTRRWWFPVHATTQGLISTAFVIVAFACNRHFLGVLLFDTTHKRMGFSLFILTLVQTTLGMITHFVKIPGREGRRSPLNYFHMFLGVAIVILGWFTAYEAIWTELPLLPFPHPGSSFRNGWIAVVVLWFVLFAVVYALSAWRHRRGLPAPSGTGSEREVEKTR